MKDSFLHQHPMMQQNLKIDDEHVIVDKKDWDKIQTLLSIIPELFK